MSNHPHSGETSPRGGTTADLLARVRAGDAAAREALAARYLPILKQWARGRVPPSARALSDTDDLVQNTLIKALGRVKAFEPRREGAFLAYLRTILHNEIVDHARKANRRPRTADLPEGLPEDGPSPLEEAIGRETMEVYEQSLGRLEEKQREAVILRLELGWSHQEVADAVGAPSPNAARMMVARALTRMAELMAELRS